MTLETAKALKEAGWEKETEFYLSKNNHESVWQRTLMGTRVTTADKAYPCPSLEELLAVMPESINQTKYEDYWHWFVLSKCPEQDGLIYNAKYVTINDSADYDLSVSHSDPCEAVAQLWLKLRKEGVV